MGKKIKYLDWYIYECYYPENIYWALIMGFEDNTQEVHTIINREEIKIYYFPKKFIINGIEYEETGQQWLSQEEFRNFEYFQEEFCDWDKNIKPPEFKALNNLKSKLFLHLREYLGCEFLIKQDFKNTSDYFSLYFYSDGLIRIYGNKEDFYLYNKEILYDWIKTNHLINLQKNREAQIILAEKNIIALKYLNEVYISPNFI